MLMLGLFLTAIYALFYVGSIDAMNSAEPFGPDFVVRAVGFCMRTLLRCFGLTSTIIFDDDADEAAKPGGTTSEERKQARLARAVAGERFIGAASPHGAFAVAQIGFTMFAFRNDRELALFHTRIAGASVLFYIPVVREMLLLVGVRDASRENVYALAKRDVSVAISPGGIWEQVNTDHRREKVYCQKRLGFVRLALAVGKPLVPIYSFGENQVFRTSKFMLRARLWIARNLWVGVPIIFGRFGLPIPLPTKVTTVIGRTVELEGGIEDRGHPTDEEVERMFTLYVIKPRRSEGGGIEGKRGAKDRNELMNGLSTS